MSKFKVGDKAEFTEFFGDYSVGEVVEIIKVNNDSDYPSVDYKGEKGSGWVYQRRLKKVEPKPTKNQRITALEDTVAKQGEEIAELKVIVHQLRKPSTEVVEALAIHFEAVADVIEFEGEKYRKVDRLAREGDVVILNDIGKSDAFNINKPYKVFAGDLIKGKRVYGTLDVYKESYNRTPETVDVYELIDEETKYPPFVIPEPTPVKTPNELRAEIIEKAKLFLEKSKTSVSGNSLNGPNKGQFETIEGVYSVRKPGISKTACEAEFIVIEAKRKVICLLRGINTKKVYHRGFANCMPSDVFNEHIGRAIALGRALGLDVSEFEQAVQPNEVVKGHVVETFSSDGIHHETFEVGSVTRKRKIELRHVGKTQNLSFTPFEIEYGDRIINDTNAQYGGAE